MKDEPEAFVPLPAGRRFAVALGSEDKWMREYVAWKAVESITLRRALVLLEDASLHFLGQPFSPACRDRLRLAIAAARRDVEHIDKVKPAEPPNPVNNP